MTYNLFLTMDTSSFSGNNPARTLLPVISVLFLLTVVFNEIAPMLLLSSNTDSNVLLKLYSVFEGMPLYSMIGGRIVRLLSVLLCIASSFLFGMLSEGKSYSSYEHKRKVTSFEHRVSLWLDPECEAPEGGLCFVRILECSSLSVIMVLLPSIGSILSYCPEWLFMPFITVWLILYATSIAYILYRGCTYSLSKGKALSAKAVDEDALLQCEQMLTNPYSVNIPLEYTYKGAKRKGWVNVVNPFRATMILGTPGSGKSYSVYGPFIREMVQKGYSMFVYDYKYPDLTSRVMGEYFSMPKEKRHPSLKMYFVDFDHPERSHRFNPIHPRYLKDPVDSTEMAETIMKNASRVDPTRQDFFSLSAQCYIDLLIWFLKIYKNGIYCTFPHLIELMGQDYRQVFSVMEKYEDLSVKRNTFSDAIKDKAYQQLQGQIASARVPLARFASKTLYWTLSGDDFSLDINNPLEPKIICVGNNPLRQSIYGTALAMLTSQLFKMINVPGKRHTAVLVDELPTIYLKGLDNLIGTARSNRIAVVLGAQDRSQLVRDYGRQESDVIMGTVGNLFSGSVRGETAKGLSQEFGKHEVERIASSVGDKGRTGKTRSYQLRDVIPVQKIESLSQGSFCGYVTDNNDERIERKVFCGELLSTPPPNNAPKVPLIYSGEGASFQKMVEANYERIKEEVASILTDVDHDEFQQGY